MTAPRLNGRARITWWLEIASILLIAIAVLWWAIVYAQVMRNANFPVERTLPCLLYTSDRCSLAMALCSNWHFLGIRRYSEMLLWAGAILSALALLSSYLPRDTKPTQDQA
ncbi:MULTISPECIES: hypothetical protein [unclassified Mesorhizobium]|uniref:hypothetical protein n=1 Tax=unclassified Mesorhizobium TaxID=325217 RepID=UPI000F75B258|nr:MULTISPECIES: hypothetical protein [unclassified Mesorhizobium]AZO19334.1 hypothetical protein EJ070_00125 [Mesorhizobium sp. M1E.F.Ca.ET.045.02.1.1]RUW34873.1 hypothetical protein EOA38_09595 [Mesorhizobium sp. M1E.F.Ca.ET.041.01.1.1]RWD90835.1 MAG: hypothetical protein EOS38_07320 [Mesorhizobium sp.]RWD92214.1 MAG: hypothetical protein EOS39_15555 [Mesorhizobium sp.]TIV50936.1 MAG: hypothetical protein E5V88_18465 [Mesorhizobium sp.]